MGVLDEQNFAIFKFKVRWGLVDILLATVSLFLAETTMIDNSSDGIFHIGQCNLDGTRASRKLSPLLWNKPESCGCSHDDVSKWKHFPRHWPLWGESTGHRWIPLTKASDAKLRCFLWFAPEQKAAQTIKTYVMWDAMALIVTSL